MNIHKKLAIVGVLLLLSFILSVVTISPIAFMFVIVASFFVGGVKVGVLLK